MVNIDGNIGMEKTSMPEKVSGLLFDVSQQSTFLTSTPGSKFKDAVIEINSLQEAEELGITAGVDGLLFGVPHYHIQHYFNICGTTARLFVAFANCATSWEALTTMQRAANGMISQFGIWTEQSLWEKGASDSAAYSLKLVQSIKGVTDTMADKLAAPAVAVLNANTTQIKGLTGAISLASVPTCRVNCGSVAVAIGQDHSEEVTEMQKKFTTSKAPVGNVGAILGLLARDNVAENIGCVRYSNLTGLISDIEFPFDTAKTYPNISASELDALDEKGYIFPIKHPGYESGVFFNGDSTCSDGDYRTISRNRVINKSRRVVRTALLPYVNSKVKIDPTTGRLSAATITEFTNAVTDALKRMYDNKEISEVGNVTIPANQNVLKNDTLQLSYTIIPYGTAKNIRVEQAYAMKK